MHRLLNCCYRQNLSEQRKLSLIVWLSSLKTIWQRARLRGKIFNAMLWNVILWKLQLSIGCSSSFDQRDVIRYIEFKMKIFICFLIIGKKNLIDFAEKMQNIMVFFYCIDSCFCLWSSECWQDTRLSLHQNFHHTYV